jgi:hypothetical protein
MPFIEQIYRPQIETGSTIVGRTNEQYFFTEHVLRPVEATYNLISVWGEAGVGKSTLLTRSRDIARSTEFKDVCLTALVDEWPVTPAHLMSASPRNCAASALLWWPLNVLSLTTGK